MENLQRKIRHYFNNNYYCSLRNHCVGRNSNQRQQNLTLDLVRLDCIVSCKHLSFFCLILFKEWPSEVKLTEDRFLIFIFLLNGFMFYMQSLTAFGLMSLISPVTFRYGFINYFLPVIINSLQSKAICHNNDSIPMPNSHQKMALLYRLSL